MHDSMLQILHSTHDVWLRKLLAKLFVVKQDLFFCETTLATVCLVVLCATEHHSVFVGDCDGS